MTSRPKACTRSSMNWEWRIWMSKSIRLCHSLMSYHSRYDKTSIWVSFLLSYPMDACNIQEWFFIILERWRRYSRFHRINKTNFSTQKLQFWMSSLNKDKTQKIVNIFLADSNWTQCFDLVSKHIKMIFVRLNLCRSPAPVKEKNISLHLMFAHSMYITHSCT